MGYDEVKLIINDAINTFYCNDCDLLFYETSDPKVCERTISFRLGYYLQDLFKEFKVDCEYNRYLNDVKKDNNNNEIYPDIIIHGRKNNENNLIWIEVKKDTSSEELIENDRKRLEYVTDLHEKYKYEYGILIIISSNKKNCKIEYYKEGKKIIVR